jgi:nitrite reductase/ring-hydroxylating ferredoxin subunit
LFSNIQFADAARCLSRETQTLHTEFQVGLKAHLKQRVLVPMDALAYIGRNPWDKDNVYIVTGDCGIGMTHCTIAGILITDLITGKENKWTKLYNPYRFTLKASGPFFKILKDDLVSVLKKWFYNDTVELSEIKNGQAKIVELEGQKCGAFRDANGHLHIVSAECTHLKCMVVWNNDEQSWDCPCHGSRFTYMGKVINGPAIDDLPAYSVPHKETGEKMKT